MPGDLLGVDADDFIDAFFEGVDVSVEDICGWVDESSNLLLCRVIPKYHVIIIPFLMMLLMFLSWADQIGRAHV